MHTPGPWTAEFREGRAASQYGHHVHSNAHSRPGVADGRDSLAEVRGATDQEARANARLIAAAPDLFVALRDLLDAPATRPDDSGGELEATYLQRQHDARVAARAALRKAEGQE